MNKNIWADLIFCCYGGLSCRPKKRSVKESATLYVSKRVVSLNENESNLGVMWPEWAMANFFHLQMHTGMPHMGASFIELEQHYGPMAFLLH